MIKIKKRDNDRFEVTVKDATETKHLVFVSDAYHQTLTEGKIKKQKLIEKSFEFLLERESNTMILSEFDLTVIETYFPEYPQEIQKEL